MLRMESFNPFAISNKEAPIVNGNINNADTANPSKEKVHLVCDQSLEGSIGRDHFRNYCLSHFGKFSCAIDCFLELCYAVFHNHLQNITRSGLFEIIYESCNERQIHGAVDVVREPLWSWIRNRCASFSAMTADAAFSDIFTMRTVGQLNDDFQSFILIQQSNQTFCSLYIVPTLTRLSLKAMFQRLLYQTLGLFIAIFAINNLEIFLHCDILLCYQHFK